MINVENRKFKICLNFEISNLNYETGVEGYYVNKDANILMSEENSTTPHMGLFDDSGAYEDQ